MLNPRIILTGAGFSVPWGYPTAVELAQALFSGFREAPAQLKYHLLANPDTSPYIPRDYEAGLADLQATNPDLASQLLEMILETFQSFDLASLDHFNSPSQHEANVAEFIKRWKLSADDAAPGIIATVNQDVALERLAATRQQMAPHDSFRLNIIGVENSAAGEYAALDNHGKAQLAPIKLLSPVPEPIELHGRIYYLKLHGAANLQDDQGKPVMLTGEDKDIQGDRFEAIRQMRSILRRACCEGPAAKILTIGYSFRDREVDTILSEAVNECGASLTILDPNAAYLAAMLVRREGWNPTNMVLISATAQAAFMSLWRGGSEQRTKYGRQIYEWLGR